MITLDPVEHAVAMETLSDRVSSVEFRVRTLRAAVADANSRWRGAANDAFAMKTTRWLTGMDAMHLRLRGALDAARKAAERLTDAETRAFALWR